ncbi:MAG: Fe-S cluster assembly protein SufD, partial [Pirellulales bacterium]
MATATVSTGINQNAFDAFLASRDEPPWLTDHRQKCWRRFLEVPMPSVRDEEWMRTDIRLFKLDRYHLPEGMPHEGREFPHALLAAGVELGGRTVSVDSRSVLGELSPELAKKGVLFGSLGRLISEHGDLLRPFFERHVVDPFKDKFSALNAAAWSGGPLLYVPKGVRVEQPLHTLSALADGGVDMNKTLVILEPGAEATLLTETASETVGGGG